MQDDAAKNIVQDWLGCLFREEEIISIDDNSEVNTRAVRLIHRHFLGSRFSRLSSKLSGEKFPSELKYAMALEYQSSIDLHQRTETQLTHLLEIFRQEGIPCLPIKGWSFARRIYAYPEDRIFTDLDLLFPSTSKSEVDRILKTLKYSRNEDFLPIQASAEKAEYLPGYKGLLPIEAHFELGFGTHQMNELFTRSQAMTIHGGLPCLDMVDEYLFHLFHGAVQHRYQKLIWLLDIYQLNKKNVPFDKTFLSRLDQLKLRKSFVVSDYFISILTKEPPLSARLGLKLPTESEKKSWLRWFEKIAMERIEESWTNKLGVRFLFSQRPLPSILDYGAQHALAQLKSLT